MKISYTIQVKEIMNENEIKSVLQINQANLVENGGQLHYQGILTHDYVVLAKHQEKVIAYTLLKENFLTDGDIYVMQAAVDNDFKHQGVGFEMYNYIYKHSKPYKFFTANVN